MDERRAELAAHMPGFSGLIEAVQGLLVGWSLATGEIWETTSVEQTRDVAVEFAMRQLPELVNAWGVEQ